MPENFYQVTSGAPENVKIAAMGITLQALLDQQVSPNVEFPMP